MLLEETVQKYSKQKKLVEKVTVQKIVIGFWTVTSNYKAKYWASADLFLLIKNIM